MKSREVLFFIPVATILPIAQILGRDLHNAHFS